MQLDKLLFSSSKMMPRGLHDVYIVDPDDSPQLCKIVLGKNSKSKALLKRCTQNIVCSGIRYIAIVMLKTEYQISLHRYQYKHTNLSLLCKWTKSHLCTLPEMHLLLLYLMRKYCVFVSSIFNIEKQSVYLCWYVCWVKSCNSCLPDYL